MGLTLWLPSACACPPTCGARCGGPEAMRAGGSPCGCKAPAAKAQRPRPAAQHTAISGLLRSLGTPHSCLLLTASRAATTARPHTSAAPTWHAVTHSDCMRIQCGGHQGHGSTALAEGLHRVGVRASPAAGLARAGGVRPGAAGGPDDRAAHAGRRVRHVVRAALRQQRGRRRELHRHGALGGHPVARAAARRQGPAPRNAVGALHAWRAGCVRRGRAGGRTRLHGEAVARTAEGRQ